MKIQSKYHLSFVDYKVTVSVTNAIEKVKNLNIGQRKRKWISQVLIKETPWNFQGTFLGHIAIPMPKINHCASCEREIIEKSQTGIEKIG